MGFRFRKSIRLLPGVRINLGRRGASVSLGRPGATVNISQHGTRTTVGLPGTGLSYSTYEKHQRRDVIGGTPPATPSPTGTSMLVLVVAALMLAGVVAGLSTAGAGILVPIAIGGAWWGLRRYLRRRSAAGVGAPGAATPPAPASIPVASAPTPSALPPLPPRAAAVIAPLLAERARLEAAPPSPTRDAELAHVEHALRQRLGEIAASPWRYR